MQTSIHVELFISRIINSLVIRGKIKFPPVKQINRLSQNNKSLQNPVNAKCYQKIIYIKINHILHLCDSYFLKYIKFLKIYKFL